MKYSGKYYDWDETGLVESAVSAVVTTDRLSVDWDEDGEKGHLEAHAVEGVYYRGYYGYPRADPNLTFELRKYKSKGNVIFFGTWKNRPQGWAGNWMFVLWPEESAKEV